MEVPGEAILSYDYSMHCLESCTLDGPLIESMAPHTQIPPMNSRGQYRPLGNHWPSPCPPLQHWSCPTLPSFTAVPPTQLLYVLPTHPSAFAHAAPSTGIPLLQLFTWQPSRASQLSSRNISMRTAFPGRPVYSDTHIPRAAALRHATLLLPLRAGAGSCHNDLLLGCLPHQTGICELFCKGPESKYFRLGRTYGLWHNNPTLL